MKRKISIVVVIGARPQFVKAATVSRQIAAYNASHATLEIEERIIHTGQHYDDNMSKVFFDEMEIPRPTVNLKVGSGSHGAQTGKMLERIEAELESHRPDRVLVYGDTNSTLAGALAASKLHIPVAHVEAGLRSFNRQMPEEINRVLTDHLSDLLFCPTDQAMANLSQEGIASGVHRVGDVMADALFYYAKRTGALGQALFEELHLTAGHFYLATVHRAENTDDDASLRRIFKGLGQISREDLPCVLPLHPRTRARMEAFNIPIPLNVSTTAPMSYMSMLALEKHARGIITDSGGVQKEAYLFKVPCITLRNETEWVETVDAGWNTLVGSSDQALVEAARRLEEREAPAWHSLYGDGRSAEQIVDIILSV